MITSGPLARLARIVLIDDNSADNIYHRLVLADHVPHVAVVDYAGGREALCGLADTPAVAGLSLILVDLNMPAMTGWEFIERYFLEVDDPTTLVAVLSTAENPTEVRRALDDDNICGIMSKPLTGPKLSDLLITAC
jgi:CheY-like chemotaxis protein